MRKDENVNGINKKIVLERIYLAAKFFLCYSIFIFLFKVFAHLCFGKGAIL